MSTVPPYLLDFDPEIFNDIFQDIKDKSEEINHDPENLGFSEAYSILLNVTTMQRFFLWFVQNDLIEKAGNLDRKQYNLPGHAILFELIDRYRPTDASNDIPDNGTHILHKKEYLQAKEYSNKHKLLGKTIALVQTGLSEYFTYLEQQLAIKPEKTALDSEFVSGVESLIENGIDNLALTQELLPAIAFSASEKENASPNFSLETRDALRLCFKRNGFYAMRESWQTLEPVKHTCPMKKIIGHVLNTGFDVDENQELKISEKPIPGGLNAHIYELLSSNKHGQNTSTKKLLHKPSR